MAKSAPRSVAYTLSASSGHSIAASAARSVSTSSRSWNDRPPTSRCGMLRASSASTYGRVMSSWNFTNRRNRMQTCRASTGTCRTSPSRRSVTRHPLWCTSQSTQAPTASGRDFSIGPCAMFFTAYGSGTGKTIIEGWGRGAGGGVVEPFVSPRRSSSLNGARAT
jgi:hypothetical protein